MTYQPVTTIIQPRQLRRSLRRMTDMEMYISELDGNKVAYTDCTEFLIQVGKGKGSYKTTMKFTGKLISAVTYYRAINLGNGHKKRLLMPSCSKKPVLARHFS